MQRHVPMFFVLFFAACLAACSGGSSLPGGTNSAGVTAVAQRQSVARPLDNIEQSYSSYTAIDSGGSANGNWVADQDYNGGAVSRTNSWINTSKVSNPAPEAVYQTQRYGQNFTYVIPGFQPYGSYLVRLHFAESFFNSPGQRVFTAKLNGSTVLSNFDIFSAAGGENIAIVRAFTVSADSSGSITASFYGNVNYPTIGGIEIIAGSQPSPSPNPSPSGAYPIFSSRFYGAPSPFHETVSYLTSHGARLESQTLMNNLWAQSIETNNPANSNAGTATPIYNGVSGDPTSTVSCNYYGSCNASGKNVHFPYGAKQQTNPDHHIVSSDTVLGGEFDGWQCDQSWDIAACGWGGWFPYGGNGLDQNSGNSGNNAGYAFGIFTVTAQELLNGKISHALGLIAACLDNPTIYPADTSKGTDTSCSGHGYPSPSAHYGDLLHLKSSYNIGWSSYSSVCKTILTALQTYGAYTVDTNTTGLVLELEYGSIYASPNPYFNTIYPNMAAAGDGSGSNSSFVWQSCLQRLNASDFELYAITPGT